MDPQLIAIDSHAQTKPSELSPSEVALLDPEVELILIRAGVDKAYIYACKATRKALLTPETQHLWSPQELVAWHRAYAAYQAQAERLGADASSPVARLAAALAPAAPPGVTPALPTPRPSTSFDDWFAADQAQAPAQAPAPVALPEPALPVLTPASPMPTFRGLGAKLALDLTPSELGAALAASYRLAGASMKGRIVSVLRCYTRGLEQVASDDRTLPPWYGELDLWSLVYLGAAHPARFGDEDEFYTARDAWYASLQTAEGGGFAAAIARAAHRSTRFGALAPTEGSAMQAMVIELASLPFGTALLDPSAMPLYFR